MTSRRIDRILLGLGALLILISSYQLFFKTAQSEAGSSLGTLTSTMSVVKTKSALAMDWRDALKGLELSENQLIYTDESSSAEIVFNQGGSLEVGENSLIKLRSGMKEQELDLSHGFIRAKLDDKPIKVQMNGEDYLVSGNGADIQINIQDKKGEIGVLQGEVKVESANAIETLDTSNALSIEGKTVNKKNIYFKVESPLQNEVIYRESRVGRVRFSWTPKEEAKIVISKRPSLEGALIYTVVSGSEIELEDGLFYYRVESEKGTSLMNSIRLIEETPPVILRPINGQKISVLDGETPALHLQWKDDQRERYSLEWSDGENHSLIVQGSSALIPVKRSGALRWRIKIQNEKRPLARFSEWQNLEVSLISLPIPPQELSPDDVEFQTYEKPNETIDLEWKSDSAVELEMIDPVGETISKKIIAPSEKYVATQGGTYRWRLRSIDNYLRTSEWTEWKSFRIEDLSGEKNAEGIQRIQLKKPDQSVTFSWNAGEGTVSVFELAKDAQFQKIVKKVEGKRNEARVSIPETGAFYWRSRQYLPDGTFNVSEPKRVIIEPVPAPDKPNKLPDLEIPIEDFPVKKVNIFQRIWNLIIPSAYADDELQGMARIVLPTEEEAKGYIVRIFKDEALTQLVFEMELDTKEFVWKFARPGTYYWQYAVIDFWDRRSLFSDPATLTIKGELTPPPSKPRLLFPIRAEEVGKEDLTLKWTTSKDNEGYRIEVSRTRNFKKEIFTKEVIDHELDLAPFELSPDLYFWRVTAFNKKKREVRSNIGRFILRPPLEKILIIDKVAWTKNWKKRLSFAWTPSMDSYTFKDSGETGKIDGNALMGLALKGTMFFERGALNGEIVRQTGKVFESEEYLFQRILVDYVYTWNLNSNHRLGAGIAIGQTSGQSYAINDLKVSGNSESAPSYGIVFRNYLSFNERWEMQGRLQYLTGDITQLDVDAHALRHQKKFFYVGGVGFSSRSYSTGEGEQTSLRISLGIGKEF